MNIGGFINSQGIPFVINSKKILSIDFYHEDIYIFKYRDLEF